MKATAIICEYNPLTNGHVRQMRVAKEETGADTIICIMGGSFTQRGESAILDKYTRAKTAILSGADIVIELPTVYAISPADNFAYGAVKMLASLPFVQCISFGSECGDIALLQKAADFIDDEPNDFKIVLNRYLSDGYSYPKAYSLALSDFSEKEPAFSDIKDIVDAPNNSLGICYMRAAKKLGFNVAFHTMKRENNDSSFDLIGEYPSASAIRRAIRREKFDEVKQYVPEVCFEELLKIKSDGTPLNDLCLYKMKSVSGYDLEKIYDMDVSGGLHNRLKMAAYDSVTFDEFLEKAKTKKYTMARIKRICLYNLFDITQKLYNDIDSSPAYYNVLAINKERKDILTELSNIAPNVIVRYADTNKVGHILKLSLKLDFQAQGTLNLINRTQKFDKTTLFV